MAWTNIPDSVLEAGKPIRAIDGRALRDNVPAVAEGADGAPLLKAGWYPFDAETVGDGADGVLWDRSVDGIVTSITSPTFEAGFEYLVALEGVRPSSGTADLIADLRLATTLGYLATATYSGMAVSTINTDGFFTIPHPSIPSRVHMVGPGAIFKGGSGGYEYGQAAYNSTIQGVDQVRLRLSASSFAQGKVYLYKRGGGLIT